MGDSVGAELVWDGKYDQDGAVRRPSSVGLPFQVIERINKSRATRERERGAEATLFDVWKGDEGETFEDGWYNKLIWGNNDLVIASLLQHYAGRVELIYIDPPFATGLDFSADVMVGDSEDEFLFKEQSLIQEFVYTDTWGRGLNSYLNMMFDRLVLMRQLLSPTGTIYVHCDWHMGHYIKLLLDEVLGSANLLNEIVWNYKAGAVGKASFGRKHDTILRYSRVEDRAQFHTEEIRIPYADSTIERLKHAGAREKNVDKVLERGGKVPTDVWDIGIVQGNSAERQNYPTQKPEALLDRIILASSSPGDVVADFFVGSGTTSAVAEKRGRRWIACDLGRYAIHVSRKRLLDIEGCNPFEILNLGKYERRYWQAATFSGSASGAAVSIYEYVAFVLKLYGATAVSGLQHLHGKRSSAFVHVGAVDSPVTIDEIAESVDECAALKGRELHVLGWEWEMGLHDPLESRAAERGIKLVLRQIPRQVMDAKAVDRGDIEFLELAYLEVVVSPTKTEREYVVDLKDFVIPNPELAPEDVRDKIKKWSDFVDYWAVDWDFSDDTFMQGWVTYRTRKKRSLELTSQPHLYSTPGEYAVMVKVIDVFGTDTSKIVRVRVD